ncbi:hypothetical protein BG015_003384, partial [Linnemannia schmuckeri]
QPKQAKQYFKAINTFNLTHNTSQKDVFLQVPQQEQDRLSSLYSRPDVKLTYEQVIYKIIHNKLTYAAARVCVR